MVFSLFLAGFALEGIFVMNLLLEEGVWRDIALSCWVLLNLRSPAMIGVASLKYRGSIASKKLFF